MKSFNSNRNNLKDSKVIQGEESLSLLLEHIFGNELKTLHQKIEEIHQVVIDGTSTKSQCLSEYISEKDAKVEFNRKTTWFWNQRNNGRLAYKKLGGTVYYLKQDLLNLLSDK
ncbi:MAG: hypothetical protein N4A74_02665 [Carboxylicivirga sp.]|jgi:hypothetical protein|nr:hypothetical protein [Carboxylicivirga sp.]